MRYDSRQPGSKKAESNDVRRDQQPVDFTAQSFSHLPASHVCNRMQGQTIEQFVVIQEVLSYAIDDQVQQLMLLVKK